MALYAVWCTWMAMDEYGGCSVVFGFGCGVVYMDGYGVVYMDGYGGCDWC